ncbi:MAG: glycoside hydrolase family 15 protein [Tepidiformaceae bacterium]
MALRIEDYAIIGDTHTAALVGLDGSIDWLCLPRFDSGACFAGLLGTDENGCWRIAPKGGVHSTKRAYREGTLILETTFVTESGSATLIDFMPLDKEFERVDVVRIVRGDAGTVEFAMDLALRFSYGSAVPWVRHSEHGISAISGPDAVELRSPVSLEGKEFHTVAEFRVQEGEQVPFTLTWRPSQREAMQDLDPQVELKETETAWKGWLQKSTAAGPYKAHVDRSLTVLKALTYRPTGGIVAAATTSLPEQIGGVRNWDYRFCWLRDATLTLYALLSSGFSEEARAWRDWLLRSCAGMPSQMQVIYGIGGERLLPEFTLPWLAGYEGSAPVRVGNAAHTQLQLDIFGEIMDALHSAGLAGLESESEAWALQRGMVEYLETRWDQPDEGMWEIRGPAQQFTHSKVMAWVALDRAIRGAERMHLEGPLDRWRALRDRIHAEVCDKGFDSERNTFVQAFGSKHLDASLLMIPQVGFLKPEDPRVAGTVTAIERDLLVDGFLLRYDTGEKVDGLPPGEGAFLACTFWYADALHLIGREKDAHDVFERLLTVCNDVGLLAEEYDPVAKRQLGNFPQAFSHVGLVNTAHNLGAGHGPARQRAEG